MTEGSESRRFNDFTSTEMVSIVIATVLLCAVAGFDGDVSDGVGLKLRPGWGCQGPYLSSLRLSLAHCS